MTRWRTAQPSDRHVRCWPCSPRGWKKSGCGCIPARPRSCTARTPVRQVLRLPAGRLHPPGDPPQAAGPVPCAAHQVRDLRDVLVLLGGAVMGDTGLRRARGDLRDGGLVGSGDHPPAGEQQGPPRGRQGQQVPNQVVAGPDAVDADDDLAPEPGGDLPDRGGQHFQVVGEGVRVGVAGAEQHVQALAGVPALPRRRVEAVAHLPGGSRPLLGEWAVTRVASMPMTTQLARVFPAISSHGNPAGVARSASTRAPGPSRGPGRSCPARTACRPGPAPGAPSGRSARSPTPRRGGPAPRCRSCSWRPTRSPPPSRPARSRGRAAATCPSSAVPRSGRR